MRTAGQGIRDAVAAATGTPAAPDSGVRASRLRGRPDQDARVPRLRILNAAAEYPDPENPVRQAVLAHRSWFYQTVLAAFSRVTTDRAPLAAAHFVMLRDGAFVEGCLADPDAVTKTFLHGADGILASFHDNAG